MKLSESAEGRIEQAVAISAHQGVTIDAETLADMRAIEAGQMTEDQAIDRVREQSRQIEASRQQRSAPVPTR